MKAIFKHELKTFFHNMSAYVFGAFLLMFIGLGAMIYNITASVSNFEYVLSFACLVFVVIIPILTMKTLAEEKKQKTDQLLYSLPIRTSEVVLGKFLALLVVFLIPVLIISVYPLIFARFGEVFLPTAYGTLFAFFLMGAAFISVGIFISSLTENQGLAAGLGVAVILFNFYSVTLSEYVSTTSMGTIVALCVLVLMLWAIIRFITGSENVAFVIALVLIIGIGVTYFVNNAAFEGLLPRLMRKLSLFERFYVFVNGIFDLTAVVFYLSCIVLFLFLTEQSLEKRRYN